MKTKKITLADLEKTDLEEQIKKIFEEDEEVKYAYKLLKSAKLFNNNQTIIKLREKQLISELYDLIQSAAGAIWILENGVSMNNKKKKVRYGTTQQIYFRKKDGVDEKQIIEQKLGRKSNSRDYIDALIEKLK